MNKYFILLLITFSVLTFSVVSCDQDSDVSDGSGSRPAVTPSTPTEITTLNVTADVTIDTSIAELESKTMNDIVGVKLYYGFGSYDENEQITEKFDVVVADVTVDKITETSGVVSFVIMDDKLAGSNAPYFMLEVLNSSGDILANMKEVYSEAAAYQKDSTHNIRLIADSLYAHFNISIEK